MRSVVPPFRPMAYGLLVAAIALRAWVALSGFYYWDDYVFFGRAANLGALDPEYIAHAHDGHIMPGAFLLTWVVERVAHYSFVVPAIILTLLQAVAWWLWLRLLIRIFGPRRLVLVPLSIVLFTTLTLPSGVWWAAAVNGIPMQIAMIVGAHALVSWRAEPRLRHLLVALAATSASLLFFEKSILIPVFLVGLMLCLDDAPIFSALRRTIRHDWPLWLSQGLTLLFYWLVYSSAVNKSPSLPDDLGPTAELLTRAFTHTVVPAAAGGPLEWLPTGFGTALALPPTWFIWLSMELLLVVVVATVWLRPVAWRGWAFAGLYVLADVGLVVLGRLKPEVTPAIVQGLRYTADAALPLSLAAGMALMPLLGRASATRELHLRSWISRHRLTSGIAIFLAADVFFMLCLVSQVRFRNVWRDQPSRAYIEQARASLAAADPAVPLLAHEVPQNMLYGLAFPHSLTSWFLAPLKNRPPFGNATSELKMLDETGRMHPAVVIDGPTAKPGPAPNCGWLAEGKDVSIDLTGTLIDFEHTLRLSYLAGSDFDGLVSIGLGDPVPVSFTKGVGQLFVRISGGGAAVKISGLPSDARLCTNDVIVGRVQMLPEVLPS